MMIIMITTSNTDRVLELFVDLFYHRQNLFQFLRHLICVDVRHSQHSCHLTTPQQQISLPQEYWQIHKKPGWFFWSTLTPKNAKNPPLRNHHKLDPISVSCSTNNNLFYNGQVFETHKSQICKYWYISAVGIKWKLIEIMIPIKITKNLFKNPYL